MVVSKKGARLKQPNTSSAGLEVQENRRPENTFSNLSEEY